MTKGISFLGGLTLLFIALKLLKVIKWSWLWVLAPSWIPAALAAIFFAVIGVMFLIALD